MTDCKQPMIRTIYHADLSDLHPEEKYWVYACGARHPLVPHTEETRAAAVAAEPQLAGLAAERLTHFTEEAVDLPADTVVRVHIKHTLEHNPGASAEHGVSHAAIHCPPTGAELERVLAENLTRHRPIDYVTTAKTLVFHHPDLINKDPDTTGPIVETMDCDVRISGMFEKLGTKLKAMGPPSESDDPQDGWAQLVPHTPPKAVFDPPIEGTTPDGRKYKKTGYDGKKTYYMHQPREASMEAMGPVMTAMMKATKNDQRLKVKEVTPNKVSGKWTQQTGTSVETSTGPEAMALADSLSGSVGDKWNASVANKKGVHGLRTKIDVLDRDQRKLKLTLENEFIRYLGGYVRFYDADGKALKPPADWAPSDGGLVNKILDDIPVLQYDDLRLLGFVGPVNNVFAIPIASDPGRLEIDFAFPPKAVSASVYGSGLGTGANPWPASPTLGGILTGFVNLGIPAFMLAAQTAMQVNKPFYDLIQKLSKNKAVRVVLGSAITAYFGTQFISEGVSHKRMNWKAFASLASLLFNKALLEALLYIEAEMAAEEAAEEIPFAGWIVWALNVATGLAQMTETIVEVSTSPWNIENKISTSVTTGVTLHPDPRKGTFPEAPPGSKVSYTVKMIYKGQARPARLVEHDVPPDNEKTSLPAAFPNNTLGGHVKLEADYFVGDWLAAKATTGWLANDEETVGEVDLTLVEYPVPLTDKSIYQHSRLLTYQDGGYRWQPTADAPTATVTDRNTAASGNALGDWRGLTLSQKEGMLGFAWQAAGMGITSCATGSSGQLDAMQNVDIPGKPMRAEKFPSCGFDGPTQLIYDPYPPRFLMKDGQWVKGDDGKPVPDPADVRLGEYYVDPRKAPPVGDLDKDGGYHLRKVTLDESTPFDVGTDQLSYGRFPFFPTSMVLHPSGHVIAVTADHHANKLQITPLTTAGAKDSDVPVARTYAGEALEPDRAGLLFRPVAVTCSYDGTVLVLEDTKGEGSASSVVLARLQAFDLYGNPVDRFLDAEGKPSPFLTLSTSGDFHAIDVAAVGNQKLTNIYVLYYTGAGSDPSDYHMAIYQYGKKPPVKNPLVTTDGVSASRLAVDMWHTAYTLSYAMVTDGKGHPAGPKNATTGPGGRTVPSVSEWLPPAPTKKS